MQKETNQDCTKRDWDARITIRTWCCTAASINDPEVGVPICTLPIEIAVRPPVTFRCTQPGHFVFENATY